MTKTVSLSIQFLKVRISRIASLLLLSLVLALPLQCVCRSSRLQLNQQHHPYRRDTAFYLRCTSISLVNNDSPGRHGHYAHRSAIKPGTRRTNLFASVPDKRKLERVSGSTHVISSPDKDVIPAVDAKVPSRLEHEFYSMIRDMTAFTPRDIRLVPNPSYRALYEGLAAGACEPALLNAFAILFEDVIPVRIAGRMIYRHLKNVMETCIQHRLQEEQRLMLGEAAPGTNSLKSAHVLLSLEAIDERRKVFMAACEENNGKDGVLTMDQLVSSGIVEITTTLMNYDSLDDFVKRMDCDGTGRVNFETFMIGIQRCARDSNSGKWDVECSNLSQIMQQIGKRMSVKNKKEGEKSSSLRTQRQKKKHSDRYDTMVKAFEDWEKLVPDGEGRMLNVLRGCFAGAKNETIARASKIAYMEYSVLRVGGDFAFMLVSRWIQKNEKRGNGG